MQAEPRETILPMSKSISASFSSLPRRRSSSSSALQPFSQQSELGRCYPPARSSTNDECALSAFLDLILKGSAPDETSIRNRRRRHSAGAQSAVAPRTALLRLHAAYVLRAAPDRRGFPKSTRRCFGRTGSSSLRHGNERSAERHALSRASPGREARSMRSHRFPYLSENTATMPYSSCLGSC